MTQHVANCLPPLVFVGSTIATAERALDRIHDAVEHGRRVSVRDVRTAVSALENAQEQLRQLHNAQTREARRAVRG